MSERLYLIDSNSVAFFKHHDPTHENLVDGVSHWLSGLLSNFNPVHIVACGDCSRADNWRKKLYEPYKSGRDSLLKDEELIANLKRVPQVYADAGVPFVVSPGMEGDDVMATLASRHEGEVIIVSSDGDMHQLIDDRVGVYDPRQNTAGVNVLYDVEAATAKHHVPPHRIRELKAIAGDSSDSLPGVKGLGMVFARHAIQQTKSRTEIFRKAALGELKNVTAAQQKKLIDAREDFDLFYTLVGLRTDAEIPEDFSTTRSIL